MMEARDEDQMNIDSELQFEQEVQQWEEERLEGEPWWQWQDKIYRDHLIELCDHHGNRS